MYSQPYNRYFKRPDGYAKPRRSPTPPRAFIEPLSPGSSKPHALEPSFNYPAINNNVSYAVHPQHLPPQNGNRTAPKARTQSDSLYQKRGHHRTTSTIDTLAEAALAVSPSFVSPAPRPAHANGHTHAHPPVSYHGNNEPPHKRARSELLPSPLVGQYASRPATSYDSGAWSQYGQQQSQASYESRVEEAALLLNFRTGGWPSASNTTAPLAPPAVPTPVRPHANSFPRDVYHQRPVTEVSYTPRAPLLPPFYPRHHVAQIPPPPAWPSPQQTSEGNGPSPKATSDRAVEDVPMLDASPLQPQPQGPAPHQTHTPPDDSGPRAPSSDVAMSEVSEAPKRRGWPKGKSRAGAGKAKPKAEKVGRRASKNAAKAAKTKNVFVEVAQDAQQGHRRRNSLSSMSTSTPDLPSQSTGTARAQSVPRDLPMVVRDKIPAKAARKQQKVTPETVCAGCSSSRESANPGGELDEWISCNGCKKWFHVDCAGFKKALEVRDVDKYFCIGCESSHGKTTYVRKSTRAHTSVDYAELQRGVLKTSEESAEHHYIQPIKDGTFTFDPETFPRMRPELVTREFLERSGAFTEPICIPAAWNPRPWELRNRAKGTGATEASSASDVPGDVDMIDTEEFEYDTVQDDGQDRLDMVMPKGLTVRQVCNMVGGDTPLDVIDVKTQNSGSKWNLKKWADYYEEESDDKAIRNVISLEVSQTKLGRLLRRPKVVRDIDLQDEVWPQEEKDKGKFPKVQFYCLMSIGDSYTDFHIDFGGSSVYYHILRGKKTFFFIPPKAKYLKAYEEWNESPQQNFTFLPHTTKECYRVDLHEGDTMLIPSGWIHAVWTPETSLVIGGNFLNRLSYKNQFKVVEIEKNNETPQKFRYPHFQRIMWYTAIRYLKDDPLPQAVSQDFYEGHQFMRERPVWEDWEGDLSIADRREGAQNARYYSQAEVDGLPELVNFIFRTVMLVQGRIEGISQDKMKRVNASIPKGHGEPLEIAKTFALWVAWKRGNEDPPAWAHPDAILPNSKEEGAPKKLSARALKDMERKEAIAAWRIAPDRQSRRVIEKKAAKNDGSATPAPAPGPSPAEIATSDSNAHSKFTKGASATPAKPFKPSPPSQMFAQSPPRHQSPTYTSSQTYAPTSTMMMNGFSGQFLSTPKTSVLGPKRVACDTCRKRRIRCKHKELVIQGPPPVSFEQQFLVNGDSNNFFFGQAQVASEVGDNIIVSPQCFQESQAQHYQTVFGDPQTNGNHQSHAPNSIMTNGTSHANGEQHAEVATPGTNAYVTANIPMAMNGVPMFGEPSKRGRSKACLECRKSKRRCVHDDNGNVDPVKAAESPVPRGSATSKKRSSDSGDNGSPSESSKRVKPAESNLSVPPPPAMHGMHGVLKPTTQQRPLRPEAPATKAAPEVYHNVPGQFWQPDPSHPDQEQPPLSQGQPDGLPRGSAPPIDPSLFSMYAEPSSSSNPYASAYPPPDQTADRPNFYGLPSLEQIATEVLDMDGRGDEAVDTGLSAIQAYNRSRDEQMQTLQEEVNARLFASGISKPDGSVDSGVSMSAAVNPVQDPNGTVHAARPVSSSQDIVFHHELPLALPSTEISHAGLTQTAGSPEDDRRSSIVSIPFYQPPMPMLSKSPEMTRGMLNGMGAASSPGKKQRDSFSSMFGSPSKERRQSRGASQALEEESEDSRLARALQQDDRGLRRRMS